MYRDRATDDGATQIGFQDPDNAVNVLVVSYYSAFGWGDRLTVREMASSNLEHLEDRPGFELLSLSQESPTVYRSRYRYDGEGDYCAVEGFGLHVLLRKRAFYLDFAVCAHATDIFGGDFAEKVLDGFIYTDSR